MATYLTRPGLGRGLSQTGVVVDAFQTGVRVEAYQFLGTAVSAHLLTNWISGHSGSFTGDANKTVESLKITGKSGAWIRIQRGDFVILESQEMGGFFRCTEEQFHARYEPEHPGEARMLQRLTREPTDGELTALTQVEPIAGIFAVIADEAHTIKPMTREDLVKMGLKIMGGDRSPVTCVDGHGLSLCGRDLQAGERLYDTVASAMLAQQAGESICQLCVDGEVQPEVRHLLTTPEQGAGHPMMCRLSTCEACLAMLKKVLSVPEKDVTGKIMCIVYNDNNSTRCGRRLADTDARFEEVDEAVELTVDAEETVEVCRECINTTQFAIGERQPVRIARADSHSDKQEQETACIAIVGTSKAGQSWCGKDPMGVPRYASVHRYVDSATGYDPDTEDSFSGGLPPCMGCIHAAIVDTVVEDRDLKFACIVGPTARADVWCGGVDKPITPVYRSINQYIRSVTRTPGEYLPPCPECVAKAMASLVDAAKGALKGSFEGSNED